MTVSDEESASMNAKTAILGASGYTGAELLRLIRQHPAIEITAPLQLRMLTAAEKRARREAGRNGPQGPGAS